MQTIPLGPADHGPPHLSNTTIPRTGQSALCVRATSIMRGFASGEGPIGPAIRMEMGAAALELVTGANPDAMTRIEYLAVSKTTIWCSAMITPLVTIGRHDVPTHLALSPSQLQHALARACGDLRTSVMARFEAEVLPVRQRIRSGEMTPAEFRSVLERQIDPRLGRTFEFDNADPFVEHLFELPQVPSRRAPNSPESFGYQPTPVRLLLMAIQEGEPRPGELIVDVGGGPGRSTLLLHYLTESKVLNIDCQERFIHFTNQLANRWDAPRISTWHGDARAFDFKRTGSWFYLFNPFGGGTLDDVVHGIEGAASYRKVTVCSLGDCSKKFREQRWLRERHGDVEGNLVVLKN